MKKTLKEFLEKNNACKGGYLFAKDLTLEEFLATCPRGDWILWLFVKSNPDSLKELTLAKGHCANTVRHLMEDERSLRAVDVAIAFGEGKATKKELDSASAASAAASDAAFAASDTADAAAYAADAANAASAASAAASDAASAADAASGDSTSPTYEQNQMETADICRKYLPLQIWNIK